MYNGHKTNLNSNIFNKTRFYTCMLTPSVDNNEKTDPILSNTLDLLLLPPFQLQVNKITIDRWNEVAHTSSGV